ncbi:peptidase [Streptomyces sp. WAC07149]|nr:peptidase [Streptomyces sp. WAC07149]
MSDHEDAPPPYPGDAAPPYPGEEPPAYPAPVPHGLPDETPPTYPAPPPMPPAPPPTVPYPAPVTPGFGPAADHDDLALDQGRRMVKAVQRGIDGAALSHLLVTVPIGLVSLAVVAGVAALSNPLLGAIAPVVWLLSGPLIFNRKVESAIAQNLFNMRRPTPEEARRLDVVWEQVTRRAGVDRETYELWIQERAGLNATAAAGHIVAVTRHAMDQLPNSRLGSVLAHELGHHVGGHTWAAMLADWYALPARAAGRAVLAVLLLLFRTKHWAGVACGGCLSLLIVQFLFLMTFMDGMWWLVLSVAAGPLLIAWLHRRAEFRADAYAVGLGFGAALEDVLMAEARAAAVPAIPPPGPAPLPLGAPPIPHQYPGHQYAPPQTSPGHPYAPPPYPVPARPAPGDRLAARAAHTNAEARLRNVRLVISQQVQRSAP